MDVEWRGEPMLVEAERRPETREPPQHSAREEGVEDWERVLLVTGGSAVVVLTVMDAVVGDEQDDGLLAWVRVGVRG